MPTDVSANDVPPLTSDDTDAPAVSPQKQVVVLNGSRPAAPFPTASAVDEGGIANGHGNGAQPASPTQGSAKGASGAPPRPSPSRSTAYKQHANGGVEHASIATAIAASISPKTAAAQAAAQAAILASDAAPAVAAAAAAASPKKEPVMATTLLGAALLGREGEGEGGAGPSDASTLGPLPPPAKHEKVRLKGKGLGEDDLSAANAEVRAAIEALSVLLEGQPLLQLRVAENESELLDALKLYRDMNHLSLAGGITCDQVVEHVLSHTVILFYRPDIEQDYIPVTAATFTMRQTSMMLRLLATHPRMTRKGFGRITVHFLKELCRALHKDDIIVYTYPSSSPFYKALHFRHTHQPGEMPKPTSAPAGAAPDAREASREARRVYSAKENEMIFYVQPSMEQVLSDIARKGGAQGTAAHPYACTRRRSAGAAEDGDEKQNDAPRRPLPGAAGVPAPATSGAYVAPPSQPHSIPPPSQRAVREVKGTGSSSSSSSSSNGPNSGPPPAAHKTAAAAIAATAAAASAASPRNGGPLSASRGQRGKARESVTSKRALTEAAPATAAAANSGNGSKRARGGGTPNSAGSAADDERHQQQRGRWLASVTPAYTPGDATSSSTEGDDANSSPRKRGRGQSAKEEYAVEKIVDVQRNASDPSDVKYMIKWKGWPSKYNTWEPLAHLQNLQQEIEAFETSRAADKA